MSEIWLAQVMFEEGTDLKNRPIDEEFQKTMKINNACIPFDTGRGRMP